MIRIFYRIIKDIFGKIPGKAIVCCFLDILHALSIVLLVAFTQHFFDSIALVGTSGSIWFAIEALILFLVGTIVMEVCNGAANFKIEFLSPKVIAHMYERLYQKASRIEAVSYEKAVFLDCMEKAQQGIESGVMAAWFVVSIFTFYLPYYIFMALYLRNLSPFLLLVLLFVFLPVIIGKAIRFKIFKQVEDEIAPTRRAMEYYEKVICDRDYFKETRLLGTFEYFIRLFRDTRDMVNRKVLNAEIKHARIELILRVLTVGGYVGILLILVQELLKGNITVGAFAAIFSGVGMMFSLAEEVFGGVMQYISRNAASIFNYYKFLDLEEPSNKISTDKPELFNGIELKNVCFCYPEMEKPVIRNVSLFIPEGKTVAVVGENGSGKTTLVKLMAGLYKPCNGDVWVNGHNTKTAENEKIYGECSGVFQKFQRYRMSLKDNVIISDYQKSGDIEKFFEEACINADVENSVNVFPNGSETILSREFGGIDLSGGQWQRVATARGLYRNRRILFLDEPTSAIDPLEETRVYKKFAELSKRRTTVIVTHRIGAAQIADFIVVMKEGMIDEIGTHQELIKKEGLYTMMYREQGKWYKK